jgi:hypothetical protein
MDIEKYDGQCVKILPILLNRPGNPKKVTGKKLGKKGNQGRDLEG